MDVVIPNYNGASLLERHLPAALRALGGRHRVVLVDDGSTDRSVDAVRDRHPEVCVVERRCNGGFAAAVNDGIRAGTSEFIALLNNDVEVHEGFLEPVVQLLEDGNVFAVTPRIVLPLSGNIDEGAKTGFWRHGMFYVDQRQGADEVTPVLYTTGCAAVYRRSMLEELGGFDEAYSPFYWEDADLGYRAWKRGWRSVYQPGVEVHHQHSASISHMDRQFTRRIAARNSLFFIWRNIEDTGLRRRHRRWLPLVITRRMLAGDRAFVRGWREAYGRRREAEAARARDARFRRLSDREIFSEVGIKV